MCPEQTYKGLELPVRGRYFWLGMQRGFLGAGGIGGEARRMSSCGKVVEEEGTGILEGTAQPGQRAGVWMY